MTLGGAIPVMTASRTRPSQIELALSAWESVQVTGRMLVRAGDNQPVRGGQEVPGLSSDEGSTGRQRSTSNVLVTRRGVHGQARARTHQADAAIVNGDG